MLLKLLEYNRCSVYGKYTYYSRASDQQHSYIFSVTWETHFSFYSR